MEFTFTRRGVDPATLIAEINRDLSKGMKTTAREVAKVGVKAFKSAAGARSFAGYPLKFKAKKITATSTHATVEFQASPVGFWVMLESGAKPHGIKARRKKALSWGSNDDTVARSVDHPGMPGRGLYTKGEAAAIKAMDELVEETIVEAVTSGG